VDVLNLLNKMKKSILFLIFNRPDTTKQVFEAIREYRPKQLFIAADGARNEKELKLCNETRDIVKNIDWDCKVETLFREENLGCRNAVSSAIDWFFENVENGIILEDDCLPNQSFFRFCEDMLDKYKSNEQIMHITGTNKQLDKTIGDGDYYFSKMVHVWGWATWKRAWLKNNKVINHIDKNCIKDTFHDKKNIKYWIKILKLVKQNYINSWAYIWVYYIWLNNGLAIIPNKNLIENIGYDEDATHTKKIDKKMLINQEKQKNKKINFNEIKHPKLIERAYKADLFEQNFYKASLVEKILLRIPFIRKKI